MDYISVLPYFEKTLRIRIDENRRAKRDRGSPATAPNRGYARRKMPGPAADEPNRND
jgi:hypothetical protein